MGLITGARGPEDDVDFWEQGRNSYSIHAVEQGEICIRLRDDILKNRLKGYPQI